MSELHFANPHWMRAIWGVAIMITILAWLDWRRSELLNRFISSSMQSRLVCQLSATRRWLSLLFLAIAGISLVVAMMRPQLGLTFVETPRAGAQIMVCLDVSKSMLAEDTAPNRLERAKAEISDLLSYLRGDQVGLIAFAGRATVLCPLTPDYGFLKLILDAAGPHSVGKGGTLLEEPIRKGVDGFRTASDVSRVLMLITDGEDHDSHALDAAKSAAERGIKILAIGFGDEAGSEIFVTDAKTGARTQILDSDGKGVVSRLDGQTLRDIALATEGAYIPAGTGALDLKSIYDAHIAPLVRGKADGRGHAVRHDVFQWAVLMGLVCLIASVVLRSGGVRVQLGIPQPLSMRQAWRQQTLAKRGVAAGLLVSAVLLEYPNDNLFGQSSPPAPSATAAAKDQTITNGSSSVTDDKNSAPTSKAESSKQPSRDVPVDPRSSYNDAVEILSSDCDRAEQLLTSARRDAGIDGDVRFRATYNLGMVEIERSDRLLKDKPAEALERLRKAADWFRDAARLRPDDQDTRHNLEIVLRRILELADSLAKKEGRDLTQRLDTIIDAQRGLVGKTRQLVDRLSSASGKGIDSVESSEEFRSEFRQLSLEQRQIISDGQAIGADAREELEQLKAKSDKDRTAEENVRIAQLSNLSHYISQADQRLGQANGQLRRRQSERSFRRAASGLNELKRARDQLRNPVELLDVIIADATSNAQLISLAAVSKAPGEAITTTTNPPSEELKTDSTSHSAKLPSIANPPAFPARPTWLTAEYLEEIIDSVSGRLSELSGNLKAALERPQSSGSGNSPPAGNPATSSNSSGNFQPGPEEQDKQSAQFLELVRESIPLLDAGLERFQSSKQALLDNQLAQSVQQQANALESLHRAREIFLDVRGLVELAYAQQSTTSELLTAKPVENQVAPSLDNGPREPVTAKADAFRPANEPGAEETKESKNESTVTPQSPVSNDLAQIDAGQIELAAKLNGTNQQRVRRIAKLIDQTLAEISKNAQVENSLPGKQPAGSADSSPGTKSPSSPPNSSETESNQMREQFELAKQFIGPASDAMQAAGQILDDSENRKSRLDDARRHIATSLEQLQALRRLFFSIVQHLQETAQRQSQLNDETEATAGVQPDATTLQRAGQFQQRQGALAQITQQLAQALAEQGKQAVAPTQPSNGQSESDAVQPAITDETTGEKLRQAANLVTEGEAFMQQAAEQLGMVASKSGESSEQKSSTNKDDSSVAADAKVTEAADANKSVGTSIFVDARTSQDKALEKLIEALVVLQPPDQSQPDEDNQQQDQSQSPEQDNRQDQSKQAQASDQQQADGVDPSRLLQAVRDREAQRRRDKNKRAATSQVPVDKDW